MAGRRYQNLHLYWKSFANIVEGGSDYGSAKAGTSNAATFYKNGVCAALDWGFNVFYFEAFDEPWKPASAGTNGHTGDETHWGAYDQNRNVKFPMNC